MNTNLRQINNLREIIYSSLDVLIDSDYCLLDVPDHSNIGDSLIYAGELSYLKRLPYKELYSCSTNRFQANKIPKKSIILFHGGGNFGDLYRGHQDFRNDIIKKFKENRIIVFPQTVHYETEEFLKIDSEIYNSHPDLTVCVRDRRSYEILKKWFVNNKIFLLPDMAFCIDIQKYAKATIKNKILLLKRTDKELNKLQDLPQLIKEKDQSLIDVKDWPSYQKNFFEKLVFKIDSISSRYLMNIPFVNKFVDPRYGIKSRYMYWDLTMAGIKFIDNYDEIFSTRLHGTILSVLMGKKVHMIDNSYGKNSGFYEAWMSNFDNVNLIQTR